VGILIFVIAGLSGEQRYDGFLGKLEHCVFFEDVILEVDVEKIGKLKGGSSLVGGPLSM